jgi:hypothetical protein
LPAFAAAMAISACVSFGLAMSITSISFLPTREERVGMSAPHESSSYQSYIEIRFRHVALWTSFETYQRRMALKLHPDQIRSQAEKPSPPGKNSSWRISLRSSGLGG